MDFKIDTKDAFTVIAPTATLLNANLAQNIAAQCEIVRQNGSGNYIIDLASVQQVDAEALTSLIALHEQLYSAGQSLVFTGLQAAVWAAVREQGADFQLNIAPQMIEAVDIISMEILERDLLSEE
jgi:anti-anti-sigma regulatory factor